MEVDNSSSEEENKGYFVEKIIDKRIVRGKIEYLEYEDLVPAKEEIIKCPQVVIKYYEDRSLYRILEYDGQTGFDLRFPQN